MNLLRTKSKFSNFLRSHQTVIAGTIWITVFTFGSKLLGFARQILTGALFGTTRGFDAVIIAQEPAGFISGIIASSFAIVAIPLYLEEKSKNGSKSAKQLVRSILGFTAIFLIFFGLALFFFPAIFVKIFAPGFPKSTLILASEYLRIFSILPLLTGLVSLFGAFLRAERMFFQYAFASFTLNFFTIPILWLLAPTMGTGSYAVSRVAGTAFVAFFLYLFGRQIWTIFPFSKPFTRQVLQTFYLASPLFLSIMVGTINSITDKAFASILPIGSVSALAYSFIIVGMIGGLITSGLTISSFTSISESALSMDDKSIGSKVRKANELIIKALVPIVAFTIVASPWIVAIIYQRGRFTQISTINTSSALVGYAVMILTIPLNGMLGNIYIVKKNTVRLALLSIPFVLLNAGMDWWLMGPFKQAGIAAASSIVGVMWMITLAIDIKFHYKIVHLFSAEIILPIVISVIYIWIFLFPLADIQSLEKLILEILITGVVVSFFIRGEIKMILNKVMGDR